MTLKEKLYCLKGIISETNFKKLFLKMSFFITQLIIVLKTAFHRSQIKNYKIKLPVLPF